WFVISTDRASRQSFFSSDVQKAFCGFSKECWKRFTERAPYTWDRRDPDRFKDYGPAVDGPSIRGVWNTYWKGTSDDYPGDKEGDPSLGALPGIQKTVTNALYLIGAQRRGDTGAAENEYAFLDAWFSSQKQPNLWWSQKKGGAIVHERVSRVANGKAAPGFDENWAWTGDLGLTLGV